MGLLHNKVLFHEPLFARAALEVTKMAIVFRRHDKMDTSTDWNAIWKELKTAGNDHILENSFSLSSERMSQIMEQVILLRSS